MGWPEIALRALGTPDRTIRRLAREAVIRGDAPIDSVRPSGVSGDWQLSGKSRELEGRSVRFGGAESPVRDKIAVVPVGVFLQMSHRLSYPRSISNVASSPPPTGRATRCPQS